MDMRTATDMPTAHMVGMDIRTEATDRSVHRRCKNFSPCNQKHHQPTSRRTEPRCGQNAYQQIQERIREAMRHLQQQSAQPSSEYAMHHPPHLQHHPGLIHAPLSPRALAASSPTSPPDERSILLSHPPYQSHAAPTPFAPVELDAYTPFRASDGSSHLTGSLLALPASFLSRPGVSLVVEHPMIHAVKGADIRRVKELLEGGVTAQCIDADGASALHWATRTKTVRPPPGSQQQSVCAGVMTELLLQYGASPGYLDRNGASALHWSAASGSMRATRALLRAYYGMLFFRDAGGWTPLHIAAKEGKILLMDFLMQFVPPIEWREAKRLEEERQHALQMSGAETPSSVSAGLEAPSPLNSNVINASATTSPYPDLTLSLTDAAGKSALTWAAYNNHVQLCSWILSYAALENDGAHGTTPATLLDQRDVEQAAPIHWAALQGNARVIEVLLEHAQRGDHANQQSAAISSSTHTKSRSTFNGTRRPLLSEASPSPRPPALSLHDSSYTNSKPQYASAYARSAQETLLLQLTAVDATGHDALELARDKLRRIRQERLARELAGEAADKATPVDTFSLRKFAWWQYLCCPVPAAPVSPLRGRPPHAALLPVHLHLPVLQERPRHDDEAPARADRGGAREEEGGGEVHEETSNHDQTVGRMGQEAKGARPAWSRASYECVHAIPLLVDPLTLLAVHGLVHLAVARIHHAQRWIFLCDALESGRRQRPASNPGDILLPCICMYGEYVCGLRQG